MEPHTNDWQSTIVLRIAAKQTLQDLGDRFSRLVSLVLTLVFELRSSGNVRIGTWVMSVAG